jgi:hypothetical protein
MSHNFFSYALGWLVLLGTCQANNTLATSTPAKPLKLEGMDYFHARKIILGYGWKPIGGPCGQVSKETCARFPEIDDCSGVQAAPCGMVFIKQDRCLYVGTSGGQPEGDEAGDTHVDSVEFKNGPCSKNS